METPAQRAQRILKNDAFVKACDHANTALYCASSGLNSNPTIESLNSLINAAEQLSAVFSTHDKPVENMQLWIRMAHRMELEAARTDVSPEVHTAASNILSFTHQKANSACDALGIIAPFVKPLKNQHKPGMQRHYNFSAKHHPVREN
ncbi:MAG: hypothetical protein CSA49_02750 [Gammaproteobacteria bacterium]|nr:MAG: hypothetical protein CSA49_02750 [Gammaproteobacteria bacterium]